MKETLKKMLEEAAAHYERHAEWEKARAEQATDGSNIQHEVLRAYKYNLGRAAGIREALQLIEEIIG